MLKNIDSTQLKLQELFNNSTINARNGSYSSKIDLPRAEFNNQNLLSFAKADFETPTPQPIQSLLIDHIQKYSSGYSYHPDSLYAAIINWQQKYFGVNLKKQDIAFIPGVMPGICLALKAIMNPGDKVTLFTPEYPAFFTLMEANRYIWDSVSIQDDTINFEALDLQLKNSKVLLLSNPHNPTGKVLSRSEIQKIVQLCNKYDIYLIIDEIWQDITFDVQHQSILKYRSEKTVSFSSGSKSFNTAGFQLAFALIEDQSLRRAFQAEQDKSFLNSSNIAGILALQTGYEQCDQYLFAWKKYIAENMDYCSKYLRDNVPQVLTYVPDATCLLMLDFSQVFKNCEEAEQALAKQNIYLQKGSDFKFNGVFMRLNCGTSRQELNLCMQAVKRAVEVK
ncbi:Selenocystathionine beta-lyase / Cystathionine beta-lyase [Spironucleus salmonicida]|uniref:cysteine-S-conjugate beta-lyase n=1 Tax=Spironucleus salmonicida TaxID=348837 RepID=S5U487_9EUKA|nr:aminotransferase [Spironucleus salmonicida]KAH0574130.1 Selenocystathionine beta-lyase / Cystathionine beta-lyase [Spironucleus salmonicida]|eukprot:EST47938.1 Aminotransferase [Spironucleus salmonicida]